VDNVEIKILEGLLVNMPTKHPLDSHS